eukprot:2958834-Pleurochrysis_carterae.AAC.6
MPSRKRTLAFTFARTSACMQVHLQAKATRASEIIAARQASRAREPAPALNSYVEMGTHAHAS